MASLEYQANASGLHCAEAVSRRAAGIVEPYARPAKLAWDLTRYYIGQLSAEDVVGFGMGSLASWREGGRGGGGRGGGGRGRGD